MLLIMPPDPVNAVIRDFLPFKQFKLEVTLHVFASPQ